MDNGEHTKEQEKIDPIVKLSEPLKKMTGEDVTELSVNIKKLKWKDLHNLEVEFAALFPNTSPANGVFITDTKYQAMAIGRINGLRYEEISELNGQDALNVSMRLSRFLAVPA